MKTIIAFFLLSSVAFAQHLSASKLDTANAGLFTNAQMQQYVSSIINSCNPQTEFQGTAIGSGNLATSGVVGCVAMPSSSTTFAAYGVAGFANNSTVGGTLAAGVLGTGRAIANDSSAYGAEFGASDVTNAGFTNIELIGSLHSIQTFNGSGSGVYEILNGVGVSANFTHQPATFWSGNSIQPIGNGLACSTVGSNQWNNCTASFDGASSLFAFIGTTSSASGASDSQPIQGSARASGTADTNAQIIFVHAAPAGACPALATVAINVAATTNSTVLYTCATGNNWAAVTVP